MYMLLFIYLFDIRIIKQFFGCNPPVFKSLNIYVQKLTMGVVDRLKGPYSALMEC